MADGKFTKKTKDILYKEVNGLCSKPSCRSYTTAAHSSGEKVLNNGEAAHISGRRPTSARYDSKLTDEERSQAKNGIWLCRTHAKMIDDDEAQFAKHILESWKEDTKAYVKENYGVPRGSEKTTDKSKINYLGYFPKPDFDGRFYHDGVVVFYRIQFVFDRDVTLVTMVIEDGKDTQSSISLVGLGTQAQQAYLNGIDFRITSRALGNISGDKMRLISGMNPHVIRPLISALDFSNIDHIGEGPFDIVLGSLDGNSHIFLFDLSPFWDSVPELKNNSRL